MLRSTRLRWSVLIVPLLLAGCTLPQPAATRYDAMSAKHPPPCTHGGKPIPRPAGLPEQFPLPAGTSITFTFMMGRGITITGGFIASHDMGATVTFFEDYLPLAGFTVQPVSPTAATEVDELFWGHGHTGLWSVSPVSRRGCPGELALGIQVVPGIHTATGTSGQPVDPY